MVEAPQVVVEFMGQQLGDAAFSAAVFVVSFVVFYFVGKSLLMRVVTQVLDRRKVETHARQPLMKITRFGVFFLAVAAAFALAGFGNLLTSLATIAAAATLAVGFALQNIIRNFVSGVFIYIDKPFKIGDWIEWNEYSGTVEDISLRVTRVRTFDSELLTVPNSELTENVVKNPVDDNKLRLKFVFGIGYDDDVERATEIIIEEAVEHPGIKEDPEPSVRMTELADSYVGLQSRFWISQPSRSDFVRTRSEYVRNVKERFDEEGIEIPYPQRTLTGEVRVSDLEDLEDVEDGSTGRRGDEDGERGDAGRGKPDRGEVEDEEEDVDPEVGGDTADEGDAGGDEDLRDDVDAGDRQTDNGDI